MNNRGAGVALAVLAATTLSTLAACDTSNATEQGSRLMESHDSEVHSIPLSSLPSTGSLDLLTSAEGTNLPDLPWRLISRDSDDRRLTISVDLSASPGVAGAVVSDDTNSVTLQVKGKPSPTGNGPIALPRRTLLTSVTLAKPLSGRALRGAAG